MIATTGELQRLQNLDSSDHTLELFTGIYGVGRNKAVQWVMQGLRSLKDVLAHGKVSESQRIGIELYDVLTLVIQRLDNRTLRREYQGRKLNNIVRLSKRQLKILTLNYKSTQWAHIEEEQQPVEMYHQTLGYTDIRSIS